MGVLIIGADGSMGKRYQAILSHLGKRYRCIDKDDSFPDIIYDGYIIATPTPTHAALIYRLAKLKRPILCEKPISKNPAEVRDILYSCEDAGTPLKMMFQYEMYPDHGGNGLSSYNYFRHGNDGIVWDCMQIIALARGEVSLHEDSPVWRCDLNGVPLNFAHMDHAYVAFIERWFNEPKCSFERIQHFHDKTHECARRHQQGYYNRDTGKIDQLKISKQGS